MNFTVFSTEFLDDLCLRGEAAPRKRLHSNIHRSFHEPVQRLFNAIGVDSYIRPHRHSESAGDELLLAVRGVMALLTFDDEGCITNVARFGQAVGGDVPISVGVELPSGVWHTVVAQVPGSVLFEVKKGPFQPEQAKEFALWAPVEGTPESKVYLSRLRDAVVLSA